MFLLDISASNAEIALTMGSGDIFSNLAIQKCPAIEDMTIRFAPAASNRRDSL